jgi:hypothetical protein
MFGSVKRELHFSQHTKTWNFVALVVEESRGEAYANASRPESYQNYKNSAASNQLPTAGFLEEGMCWNKEMENKSRGPTFGDLVTVARLQGKRVQTPLSPSPPSFKCNVLRESLSVNSQNIPCGCRKLRQLDGESAGNHGSWVADTRRKRIGGGIRDIVCRG